MKKLLLGVMVCALTLALANHHGATSHKDGHHGSNHDSQTLTISPDVRALLNAEMHAIKGGMEKLVLATAAADWHTIAQVGHDIKHSYILKQKLTKEQRHQLHQGLPAGFKKLDKDFHRYAGMLSHVAKEHDIELVNYYIYKMKETCSSCHSQYATDKFPGYKARNKHTGDHH